HMPARVVLAMSGGVDSSVAAYLLKKQGHDVVGLFMRTGVHQPEETACDTSREHKKGCCSAVDAGDARRVADRLDIPFYALDFEDDFARIMDYFVDEYTKGRTPNPCVVCNTWLKFGKLWSYGKQLDADFIATGHYVQMINGAVHRGTDPNKDQSYVLFGLRKNLLARLLFPIGAYTKDAVRAIAREAGLNVAEKPDSVEICFVPNNDHASFIKTRHPELATSGNIIDRQGNVLAAHDGIEKFTIGQRKGFGFGSAGRRYVLEIVPETRDVVIGDREELLSRTLLASRVNWLIDAPPSPLECRAKIRYRHDAAAATVTPLADGAVRVDFAEPQSAITPGQAVVFYDGTRLLGGAWIEKAIGLE
ncbi:MAG TPA: tRNA 2-thiouridine(34) synthase MnmA, partial [Gemmataceae bacterium]|nr:tRNA 2-thiouridine(34) synthase MnmA [Gemmataceae bacterium]